MRLPVIEPLSQRSREYARYEPNLYDDIQPNLSADEDSNEEAEESSVTILEREVISLVRRVAVECNPAESSLLRIKEVAMDMLKRINPPVTDNMSFTPDSEVHPRGRPEGTDRILSHDEI